MRDAIMRAGAARSTAALWPAVSGGNGWLGAEERELAAHDLEHHGTGKVLVAQFAEDAIDRWDIAERLRLRARGAAHGCTSIRGEVDRVIRPMTAAAGV